MDYWMPDSAEGLTPKEKAARLGDYLIAHKIIDRFDLNWAMRYAEDKHKPLGEVLVELDLCTPLQIQEALEVQKRQKERKIKLSRSTRHTINPEP